jgi:Tfp pilus assembly protein PilZ
METMMLENRKFKRKVYSLPLKHRDLSKNETVTTTSVAANISEGGVSFTSDEFVPLAQRLVLEISLPTTPDAIKAISRVIWIKKIASTDQYVIGSQFLQMRKEDKARLVSFISPQYIPQ